MNITVVPIQTHPFILHCVAGDHPDKGGVQAHHENHDSGTLSPIKICSHA